MGQTAIDVEIRPTLQPIPWEYRVERFTGDVGQTELYLNTWGKDGWELIQITENRVVFKRPVKRD